MRFKSLNMFIMNDMIEQFARGNPIPEPDHKSPVNYTMDSELLVTLLEELKALRTRVSLYEIKIIHQNQEIRELINQLNDLESAKPL